MSNDKAPRSALVISTVASVAMSAAATSACTPQEVTADPIGCSTDGCEPPDTPPATSAGDGADETGGDPQRVCSVFEDDDQIVQGSTFRWHCSGVARANAKAKLDLETSQIDQAVLDYIETNGFDAQRNFGPQFGETFEDPAVVACCETEYSYPSTPTPEDEGAEHGWACAMDCIDQACRAIPDLIRDFAQKHKSALLVIPDPCGLPGASGTPCAYWQLWDLSNYIAEHQQDCFDAFNQETTPPYGYQVFGYGGSFDLDQFIATNDPGADADWPSVSGVVVEGECGINGITPSHGVGWELPPPPLQPCTDSNDTNEENPFEAHGGGFWGPDTFVASSGQVELDGPTILGVNADGTAAIKGASNTDCESDPCTWLSMTMRNDVVRLHELQVVVPETLAFTQNNETLLLDDFRLHTDHPQSVPLVRGSTTNTFTFAAGTVKAIASGKLYGVPVFRQVWNTTPLQGTVREGRAGTYSVTLDPVSFGFTDGFSNQWTLEATTSGWIAHRRAPRADFEIRHVDTYAYLDGTTTSDGDGDELLYTWYVDGVEVGSTAVLRVPWNPSTIHVVVLHVVDSTGRDDWAVELFDKDL